MIVADMAAALVIAVLSGMGVGSGGLLVLYLTLLRDTPFATARLLNLLFFIFASGASLTIHLLRRRVRGLTVLLLSTSGLLGSFFGTRLATVLPEQLASRAFGVFLIGASVLTLLRSRRATAGGCNG